MGKRIVKDRPRPGRFVTFPEPIDEWIDKKIEHGLYRTASEFMVKIARDAYEEESRQTERQAEQAVA